MIIHICAPAAEQVRIIRKGCPTCNRSRRMVAADDAWYGWYITCLRCGDRWSDGERLERPFERGWRRRSIRSAWDQYVQYVRAVGATPEGEST